MSKKIKQAFLSVNNSYHYFMSNCEDLAKELSNHLNFSKEMDKYKSQLNVDFSQSDGVIMNDEFGNIFSVDMMMVLIGEKGKLSYDDFQSFSI